MIVILKPEADAADRSRVETTLGSADLPATATQVGGRFVLLVDASNRLNPVPDVVSRIKADPAVDQVVVLDRSTRLVAREVRDEGRVEVGDAVFGGEEVVLMAGPCTVESEEQIMATAKSVSVAGARFLRGGAYKPSTSPYGTRGLGEEGLALLREAADRYGLLVVTEVMDPGKAELVARYADMLQIGARNMQNYDLLRAAGGTGHPVLLKRGLSARYEEWLLAAEHIALAGSDRIVLCERGIRTFETATRNTLDVGAVAAMRSLTWLPVAIDPSHAAGRSDLVNSLALASVAGGADALLIEVHPDPTQSVKDGAQSLSFEAFGRLVPKLDAVARAIGRRVLREPALSLNVGADEVGADELA